MKTDTNYKRKNINNRHNTYFVRQMPKCLAWSNECETNGSTHIWRALQMSQEKPKHDGSHFVSFAGLAHLPN